MAKARTLLFRCSGECEVSHDLVLVVRARNGAPTETAFFLCQGHARLFMAVQERGEDLTPNPFPN